MMNNRDDLIDITPKTTIYRTFKNYSYSPKTALSELFDNSTASFIQYWEELKKYDENFIPCIDLKFVENNFQDSYEIWVVDNAYGIDSENINRVLQMQNRPKNTNGRNEFGMGLKAAGFWFGERIQIWTKSMEANSSAIYFDFDLEKIINNGEKSILKHFIDNQTFEELSGFEFGTVVRFSNIPKERRISKYSDLLKIVEHLSNTYFKDINDYKLQIRVVKQTINNYKQILDWERENIAIPFVDLNQIYQDKNIKNKFEEGRGIEEEVKLSLTSHKFTVFDVADASYITIKKPYFYSGVHKSFNGVESEYKKDINIKFNFNNQEYNVTGTVGILGNKFTGRENGGFILLRRGRVIVGSSKKEYYRPKEILGNPSGFVYQRLYGELNLDNFPTTQSKDKFDWDNGLESMFIEQLRDEIIKPPLDLISEANDLRFRTNQSNLKPYDTKYLKNILEKTSIQNVEQTVNVMKDEDSGESYWFTFKNNVTGKSYGYNVQLINIEGNETNNRNWMDIYVNPKNVTEALNRKNNTTVDDSFNVKLDLSSPIFSPINDNKEFLQINIAIWVKLAYAETVHGAICCNPSQIRNIISQEINKDKK